jgi:hypothetical protein
MTLQITTELDSKLSYTPCYALVAVNLPLNYNRSTKNIFILLCGGKIIKKICLFETKVLPLTYKLIKLEDYGKQSNI